MSIPEGHNKIICEVCAEERWEVAQGNFKDHLALACIDCDNVVKVTIRGGEFYIGDEF